MHSQARYRLPARPRAPEPPRAPQRPEGPAHGHGRQRRASSPQRCRASRISRPSASSAIHGSNGTVSRRPMRSARAPSQHRHLASARMRESRRMIVFTAFRVGHGQSTAQGNGWWVITMSWQVPIATGTSHGGRRWQQWIEARKGIERTAGASGSPTLSPTRSTTGPRRRLTRTP